MAISRRIRRELKRGAAAPEKKIKRIKKKKPAPSAKRRTSPLQFLREVKIELQRVSWPSKKELVSSTIIVIVAVLIITAIVYGFDMIFSRIVTLITH